MTTILSLKHEAATLTLWTDKGVMKFACSPEMASALGADKVREVVREVIIERPYEVVKEVLPQRLNTPQRAGLTAHGTPRKKAWAPRPGCTNYEKLSTTAAAMTEWGDSPKSTREQVMKRHGITRFTWDHYAKNGGHLRDTYLAACTRRIRLLKEGGAK